MSWSADFEFRVTYSTKSSLQLALVGWRSWLAALRRGRAACARLM